MYRRKLSGDMILYRKLANFVVFKKANNFLISLIKLNNNLAKNKYLKNKE